MEIVTLAERPELREPMNDMPKSWMQHRLNT